MPIALPTAFPQSPAPGARRGLDIPDLSWRIPIDPQAEVAVAATFVVGETIQGGETKYQRPIFWFEAEGTDDPRFDFGICGALLTADEVKLQHGLKERPAPQHPQRQRTRLGTKVDMGERVTFTLIKSADGSAELRHGASASGREGITMPAATRVVAVHLGLPQEADFPKVGGQRDKTKPGAWQPLYGWVLEELTINGQRLGGSPDRDPASDPTGPAHGEDPVPQDPVPQDDRDSRVQAARGKLLAIRRLVDEALEELDGF